MYILSHQISSPLPPKSRRNLILGDLSNAKPIIQRYTTEILCKSHVNGAATKLKLYSYIDIGKYLGCVKIFPLEGRPGSAEPFNVNLGLPIISETTTARK